MGARVLRRADRRSDLTGLLRDCFSAEQRCAGVLPQCSSQSAQTGRRDRQVRGERSRENRAAIAGKRFSSAIWAVSNVPTAIALQASGSRSDACDSAAVPAAWPATNQAIQRAQHVPRGERHTSGSAVLCVRTQLVLATPAAAAVHFIDGILNGKIGTDHGFGDAGCMGKGLVPSPTTAIKPQPPLAKSGESS